MAISRSLALTLLLLAAGGVQAREASSSAECAQAAQQPSIADARSAASGAPADLKAQFRLADAWSEAGCFNDALQVLTETARTHPGNHELETRLRVARSVVGEEHFFDNLDRADDQARIKRNAFRCSSLLDVDACADLVKATPNDAQSLTSQGDALLHAGRGAEALDAYRRAAALAPGQTRLDDKIAAAGIEAGAGGGAVHEASRTEPRAVSPARPAARTARVEAPAPRFSNLEPETRSH